MNWAPRPSDHNYKGAQNYLTLRLTERRAGRWISRLKECEVEHRRANDILRACRLVPLPIDDPGVQRVLRKVRRKRPLRPILVISWDDGGADIADGYHRLSAAYHLDPFHVVPCLIAVGRFD